jgi:uracil-DNA glycosylase family 4
MNQDYTNICNRCIFHNEKYPPVLSKHVHPPAKIMFIGENPSWAACQDQPFSPSTISGIALDKYYLKPLELTRADVWITDLIKCRYPKEEPFDIYHNKLKYSSQIQEIAEKCSELWLINEILVAKPNIIVTLSDKEVYQRLRICFNLITPANFTDAVGRPFEVVIVGHSTILFPMIHPDISRLEGDGDNRKLIARRKWSVLNEKEHIPVLKKLLTL